MLSINSNELATSTALGFSNNLPSETILLSYSENVPATSVMLAFAAMEVSMVLKKVGLSDRDCDIFSSVFIVVGGSPIMFETASFLERKVSVIFSIVLPLIREILFATMSVLLLGEMLIYTVLDNIF